MSKESHVTTIDDIQALCQTYALSRALLAEQVAALEKEIEAVKANHLQGIRAGAQAAVEQRELLLAAIEDGRELFRRPRSRIFHGVKVGYAKQKGKVEWDDEEAVIKRIRAQLPKLQAELLIRIKESVHKPAVYDLTAADLKRLGIKIVDDGDRAIANPIDTDIDKLVDALIGDAAKSADGA